MIFAFTGLADIPLHPGSDRIETEPLNFQQVFFPQAWRIRCDRLQHRCSCLAATVPDGNGEEWRRNSSCGFVRVLLCYDPILGERGDSEHQQYDYGFKP